MLLVKAVRQGKILEIGALGGYSRLCMLKALDGKGELTSLEINEEFAHLAQQNISAAGYGDQVTYMKGGAEVSLKELVEEGKQFDFFLIDADKERYRTYLDVCIQLASNGAMILMDNVLVQGAVADVETNGEEWPEKKQKRVAFMRDFNLYVSKHPLLFSAFLPIGDGVICSIVNKG